MQSHIRAKIEMFFCGNRDTWGANGLPDGPSIS